MSYSSTVPNAARRREIAALAMMPERGVLRVYRQPDKVRPSTLERVRRAALELHIEPPCAAATGEPAEHAAEADEREGR